MNKIKLALDVVEDLRGLANSIETLVKTMESNDAAGVSSDSELIAPPKEEPITIEQVRAVLAAKSQSGKQPEVKALIVKYGANKLTDVDPTYYKELLKEAEVL